MEKETEEKLQTICEKSKVFEKAMEKSMSAMTHVYNSNRRIIVNRYVAELKFVDSAEKLAQILTSLRKRSSILALKIKELSGYVKKQLAELYRTEVDSDILLRTCKGSCRAVLPFGVDHHSYRTLQLDLHFTDKTVRQRSLTAPAQSHTARIKLRPVNIVPAPSPGYRRIPAVQTELLTMFEDIGQNRIKLEEPSEVELQLQDILERMSED